MIAFLDANVIIYRIEGDTDSVQAVSDTLHALRREFGIMPIAVSTLSRLECLVKPLRENDEVTLRRYHTFFGHPDLIHVQMDDRVIERATLLRVQHGLKTPDALQAACALVLDAAVFVTADRGFDRVSEIVVRQIYR